MKVLVFTNLYPNNVWPNHGIFVQQRMMHAARQNQWDLRIIAPVPYYPPIVQGKRAAYRKVASLERSDGVLVYHPRYLMIPKIGMMLQGFMMALSLHGMVKRVKEEFPFDLIDAHYVYPDGFAAVLLGQWCDVPVVVSARGSDLNLLKEFHVVRRIIRYTLRQASAVVTVSHALKDVAVGLGIAQEKITVVPNGVDLDKFRRVSPAEARARVGLPVTGTRIILSVGRLTSNKGFDLLVRAVKTALVRRERKDLLLVIVGDGEFRPALQQLVDSNTLGNHVRLMGDIPHDRLYLYYSAADLFCLASEREGWPNVVVEALACGTPVLASPVGGIPEILQSERVGLLAERKVDAIATRICEGLQRDWKPDEIRTYASQFSWSKSSKTLADVFRTALRPPFVQPQPQGSHVIG
jgi:glycosyltransferase involved in cell wall biosynthesis